MDFVSQHLSEIIGFLGLLVPAVWTLGSIKGTVDRMGKSVESLEKRLENSLTLMNERLENSMIRLEHSIERLSDKVYEHQTDITKLKEKANPISPREA